MRVLVTGTSGRIGESVCDSLHQSYEILGVDRVPGLATQHIGDIRDKPFITPLMKGVDAVVHCAALHAPHVGKFSDDEFQSINVKATEQLVISAIENRVKHVVFTSTTAVYGYASTLANETAWIDERTVPLPRTIYHSTKLEAESKLKALSDLFSIPITVLRMSRCFPEPANQMAIYRLHRGIDARDVATAHLAALQIRPAGFRTFIVSNETPFSPSDLGMLPKNAGRVIEEREPALLREFSKRGWLVPESIDRVYDPTMAMTELNWKPIYGWKSVVSQLDAGVPEVLAARLS